MADDEIPTPNERPFDEMHGSAHDGALSERFALDQPVADGNAETGRPSGRVFGGGFATTDAPPTADGADLRTEPALPPGAVPAPAPRGRRGKAKTKSPWWELPLLVAIAVVVAMLIKTFLVQPYFIPSESMEKTLHGCTGCSGDRILVNKPIYHLRDPHPGDIVVFKAPSGWDSEATPTPPSNPVLKGVRWVGQLIGLVPPDENDLVKRVIAVGGQSVQCCDSQGRVQVSSDGPNGPWHSLDEPYVYENLPWVSTDKPGSASIDPQDQRTFGPVTVPKGRLWVMGDHRSVSADSRYHYVTNRFDVTDSTVPVSAVIGKAVLIVWPPSRWRTLGTPETFKQVALGVGGPLAPSIGATALVLPIWVRRRRRRRPL